MKNKIVYITGCLGFIGSYVTKACLERGWYVRGVDKISYVANVDLLEDFNKYPNFVFEKQDINDIKFLYDSDYIIHTAASSHVSNSIVNSDEFIHDNIHGTFNILELLRNHRYENQPILYSFSTDEVYSDILEGKHKETDVLKPSNVYSASKACADMLISAYVRTYGLKCVIVRPTNNFGARQYVEKLIPKIIKYLNLGRKIPLHDYGKPIRVFLHASDTTNAILTLIDKGINSGIYNISGDMSQSNLDTVKQIVSLYHNIPIEDINIDDYVEYTTREGQDLRYAIDDEKIRNLGWSPKVKFDEELPNIVEHYRNNFIW